MRMQPVICLAQLTQDLADFELVLLSVEDQRKISQFNLLAKRERQLLRMLAEEKEKYYAGVLNQAYKRAKKGK